ncbi:MAG: methyl-accepting chemotaxis protein [Prochloraceae cyanobacterium]|nr:methyl-accepting chemotaxis protein [Prochloraceae cyanobacterium]
MSNQFNNSSGAYDDEQLGRETNNLPYKTTKKDLIDYNLGEAPPQELVSRSEIESNSNGKLPEPQSLDNNLEQTSNNSSVGRWFSGLSIAKKCSLSLFACAFVPVLGLVSIGMFSLVNGGRSSRGIAVDRDYSAVFTIESNGNFDLATALQPNSNLQLKLRQDSNLLERAVRAKGKEVTETLEIEGKDYQMAARTLELEPNKSVAIWVQGSAKKNNLLPIISIISLGWAVIALGTGAVLSNLLRRSLVNPIEKLQISATKFARGDRSQRAEVSAADELGQLALSFNKLTDVLERTEVAKEIEVQQAQLSEELANASNSQEIELILNKLLVKVRQSLKVDRAIVYKFDEIWQGKIIAESVGSSWTRSLGSEIYDPCFAEQYVEQYQQGRISAIENIEEAGLTECHLKQLEPFEVRASLVVPIITSTRLFGLAIVHQCSRTRLWQPQDIESLCQFAKQTGSALNGVLTLHEKQQELNIEREQKEQLQQELFDLIEAIEIASLGDLTIAERQISNSPIGIVAGGFNAIINSLRNIVIQVQQAATKINTSFEENETNIQSLANEAIEQTDRIEKALVVIDKMNLSIKELADNATKASQVASSASSNAKENSQALQLTEESILKLQKTLSETVQKVKRLEQSSQHISKALSQVNQIALKTKVLAVNAGIEAGRAGEEGQGFVVVAEEVGKLATQSAAATKEIEQIVEIIQLETGELGKAMKIGTEQVARGTNLLEQTKQNIAQLVEVSNQIDRLVQSLSAATISNVKTSSAASDLIQEVGKMSEQTSTFSHQVSQYLQQTLKIAEELEESVNQYKIAN